MGIYKINGSEMTEEQLANLYFKFHPSQDAVMRRSLLRWAKSHFKGEFVLIHEAELVY
jgi:hypothetical protein